MAFRGDVSQIPLSNIVQALMMNGQEGVLTLEGDRFGARLCMLKIGIRPLNHQQQPPDLLRHILLKQKLLTESQFQNIFSTWVPGTSYPGDYLINRRILKPETVHTELRKQLEDFIFQIFLEPRLKYEFIAGEDSTSFELFSPDGLGESLIYNTNGVLMETVRRQDEWNRFREVIAAPQEIYNLDKGAKINAEEFGVPSQRVEEVQRLIDGSSSVEQVIARSIYSPFDVYEVLFHFHNRGLIRQLDLGEKKRLAQRLSKSLRPHDSISIYQSLLLDDPGNVGIRKKLIGLLHKNGASQAELVEQYSKLAAVLEEEDPEQAGECLRKVLAIEPRNLAALDQLFDLHIAAGHQREAAQVMRTLVSVAQEDLDSQAAIELLYKLVNYFPEDVTLFHQLAEILADTNNIDEAVSCLKSVAEVYHRRKDYQKLRKTYEKISRLRPEEGAKLRKLKDIEKRTERSKGQLVKFASITLVVGLLAGFASVAAMHELRARQLYREVVQSVSTMTELEEYQQAERLLADFRSTFPFSSVRSEAYALELELGTLREQQTVADREKEKSRTFEERSKFTKVKIKYKEREYLEAHEILETLDPKLLSVKAQREVESIAALIEEHFAVAEETWKRAELAFENGDYATAHKFSRSIVLDGTSSPTAEHVRIPVYVETIPPGAEVLVAGEIVGNTPLALRFMPKSKIPSVEIRKLGYESRNLDELEIDEQPFNPLTTASLRIELPKSIEWSFDSHGPIEGFPVAADGRVFFGNRSGSVYALKLDSRQEVWRFEVDFRMDVTGGINTWNQLIYFGSANGYLYVLNATNGQLLQKVGASRNMLPVKEAPSRVNAEGVTFVNCGGKTLSAIKLTTGKFAWPSVSTQRRQFVGTPMLRESSCIVITSSGEAVEFSQQTGKRLVTHSVTSAPVSLSGAMVGQRLIVCDGAHKVVVYDVEKRSTKWTFDCGAKITAPPTVDADYVVVATAARQLICLGEDGQKLWTITTEHPITTAGTIFKSLLIVGSSSGELLCADLLTGRKMWTYKTSGFPTHGITARGAVDDGRIYIGAQDGAFYCVTAE